jgi:hypothetical protein
VEGEGRMRERAVSVTARGRAALNGQVRRMGVRRETGKE